MSNAMLPLKLLAKNLAYALLSYYISCRDLIQCQVQTSKQTDKKAIIKFC